MEILPIEMANQLILWSEITSMAFDDRLHLELKSWSIHTQRKNLENKNIGTLISFIAGGLPSSWLWVLWFLLLTTASNSRSARASVFLSISSIMRLHIILPKPDKWTIPKNWESVLRKRNWMNHVHYLSNTLISISYIALLLSAYFSPLSAVSI